MDFVAYDKTTYRCPGDYVLWSTELLTSFLAEKIEANQGRILHNHRFYSYRYEKGAIAVQANELELSAKLLIDCMGYDSPILHAKDIVRITGYYAIFGKLLSVADNIDPIGLSNVILDSRPKYLEIFPTSSGKAYTILITPERSARISTDLVKEFEYVTKESAYKRFFQADQKGGTALWGIVPIGRLMHRALDRIYPYGEAKQANPGATATCLTKVLRGYKKTAEFLSDRIGQNKLAKQELENDPDQLDRFNRRFHLSLFDSILDWNSDDFLTLVKQMQRMDPGIVNDIIFGDLSLQRLFEAGGFLSLVRNRNKVVLKPLLKSLFRSF
jgi:hypothetical protein